MGLASKLAAFAARLTSDSKVPAAGLAAGAARANFGAGAVLQVVQTNFTTSFSTTSTSDTDSGLAATITPSSATSKILVIASTMLRAAGGQCFVYQKLWRGAIGSGNLISDGYPIVGSLSNTDLRGNATQIILDSPATTSAVTYRVSLNSAYASTVYMNSTTNPSTLTLIEVAA